MSCEKKTSVLNWITVILWSWFLISTWTDLPIPFLIPNAALSAFFILCLQILAHCNIKNIVRLKDKEINFIAMIGVVTLLFIVLSNSGYGALLTIINLCLLWYLSDKWKWNRQQIFILGLIFLYLFVRWMYKPMQFNENMISNTNTTGTITVFTLLSLITCIKFIFPNKKWTLFAEIIFICLAFCKLLIYHGRASFIALIFYIILRALSYTKFWEKKIYYKGLCYLLTLGSLVFVFIYTSIWKITGFDFVIPYWNKTIFSGRERIWYELWTYFKPHIITGIGTNVTLQSWFEYNVHNAMYNILITHGIIVFILVMIYMINKMLHLYTQYKQSPLFIPAVSGILAIYFESFFDMDLIWFPQFLVWTFMLVILASPLVTPPNKD